MTINWDKKSADHVQQLWHRCLTLKIVQMRNAQQDGEGGTLPPRLCFMVPTAGQRLPAPRRRVLCRIPRMCTKSSTMVKQDFSWILRNAGRGPMKKKIEKSCPKFSPNGPNQRGFPRFRGFHRAASVTVTTWLYNTSE
jgi:hypothetical protein